MNEQQPKATARPPQIHRGGPPKGNQNAVKSGLYKWKRHRMLPDGKDHIGKVVAMEEASIIQDLGGPENLTAMQRGIVSDTGLALGLMLLAFEEAQKRGSVAVAENGSWDLMPGLQKVKGLIDTRRQNFLALGLERRAKDVDKTIIIKRFAEPARPDNGQEQPS